MERRDLLITGLALLLILGIIGGTVFYLFHLFQKPKISSLNNRSAVPLASTATLPTNRAVASTAPAQNGNQGNNTAAIADPNFKTYSGAGFSLKYPKSWGLLTCSNSQNFELDPTNGSDQLNVPCDYALKPVSVLVNSNDCTGTPITLGANAFLKTKTTTPEGDAKYSWCTKSSVPNLNVTHRVSPQTARGYSNSDYSSQIEEMLKTVRFGGAS